MKTIYTLVLAWLMCACGQNFLNLEPISEANVANFYQNASDFNTAVVGAYGALQTYPDMYFELTSYRSDELTVGAPTAGSQDRYNNDHFLDDASNQLQLSVWANLYNGIARCNEIISRLNTVNLDASVKQPFDGETRFLRAYHYYNLINFWGDVPLVLQPVSVEESYQIGRSSVAAVQEAIEADLTLAIQSLPASYTGVNVGRATAGSARTLLAKVQLMQKRYADVATTLQPLLTGPYQLLSDVSQVFNVANKYNAEIIFAVRYNKEVTNEGHGLWLTTTAATSSLVPPWILAAYPTGDRRRDLVTYARSGTANVYVPNKYLDVVSATTRTAGNDFPLLRFSDVLLMYAEALNEQSYVASGEALSILNRVRTRAGAPAYTAATLPDQSTFRQAIYLERKLEFAYEGQRWFDLLREGSAQAQVLAYEKITVPGYRLLYPVPSQEYLKYRNPTLFPQNPGY
ncbi:RagB/SusD family nutrient uptake outer membrane protein [Spirosoma flavum]|uniref:RagB/SusD family nutrient uptake outer membrane protein n=1 Tax=Spirosoma flavum TaxID=2048557 RepID=A0ABW6AUX7_9BACT